MGCLKLSYYPTPDPKINLWAKELTLKNTVQTSRSNNLYRYCGKERDEETGLYYYGARFYAGWIGRFISTDPLAEKFPQLTPYNYASNKPITHKDLEGLQSDDEDEEVHQETKIDKTRVAKRRIRIDNSDLDEKTAKEKLNKLLKNDNIDNYTKTESDSLKNSFDTERVNSKRPLFDSYIGIINTVGYTKKYSKISNGPLSDEMEYSTFIGKTSGKENVLNVTTTTDQNGNSSGYYLKLGKFKVGASAFVNKEGFGVESKFGYGNWNFSSGTGIGNDYRPFMKTGISLTKEKTVINFNQVYKPGIKTLTLIGIGVLIIATDGLATPTAIPALAF